MTFWPILVRELREASRQGPTYWVRVTGAAGALVVFGLSMLVFGWVELPPAEVARQLFGNLQVLVFWSIWVVAPLLTADTLSRERRGGTLGLLFLTPLTPMGVVMGKVAAEALRAATLGLAIVPMLGVPLMLGGVAGLEVVLALTADGTALVLALAVGLAVSAFAREWNRAVLGAVLGAAVVLVLWALVYRWVILSVALGTGPGGAGRVGGYNPQFTWLLWGGGWRGYSSGWLEQALDGMRLLSGPAGIWGRLSGAGTGLTLRTWAWVNVGFSAAGLFAAGMLVLVAAWGIRRRNLDAAPLGPKQSWAAAWVKPRIWRQVFRSRMSRALERNPVGWLQQHRTMARLSKWGWCFLILLAELAVLGASDWWRLPWMLAGLGLALMASLGFVASASFRRERESGALELLLVTPLREAQVVVGRLRGIWAQFLPSLALLVLPLLNWGSATSGGGAVEAELCRWLPVWLGVTFVTLPGVGLWFSLGKWAPMPGWFLTLACGVGLPVVLELGWLLAGLALLPGVPSGAAAPGIWAVMVRVMAWEGAVAALCLGLSFRKLRQRSFVLA